MIYGLITISYLRDVVYEFIRDHGVCNYIGTSKYSEARELIKGT